MTKTTHINFPFKKTIDGLLQREAIVRKLIFEYRPIVDKTILSQFTQETWYRENNFLFLLFPFNLLELYISLQKTTNTPNIYLIFKCLKFVALQLRLFKIEM